jgi:S-adenosylmethionine hydrolase
MDSSPRANGIVTVTTDFGSRDAFGGVMSGVILGIHPDATIVTLTHGVPPQHIRHGALVLANAWHAFPPGTVHLAVVDPGVGTARQPLAATAGGCYFVGPDNGLLALALADAGDPAIVRINASIAPQCSTTFHGRDIFAPAAAHLSGGGALAELGPVVTEIVQLPLPAPVATAESVRGVVMAIDGFGNLATNISAHCLAAFADGRPLLIRVGGREIVGVSAAYGDGAGELVAVVNSADMLEVAVAGGSAAALLGIGEDAPVTVLPVNEGDRR